jgi:hypothetical protein
MNLFDNLSGSDDEEVFAQLLSRERVWIEQIVSTGQSKPADQPYNRYHDEWVLLVSGSAGLWIEGDGERELCPAALSQSLDDREKTVGLMVRERVNLVPPANASPNSTGRIRVDFALRHRFYSVSHPTSYLATII